MPITDEDSARAWLETQSDQRVQITFAARASLRAAPGLGFAGDEALGGLALPVLRAMLISGVAGVGPTPEIKGEIRSAARSAAAAYFANSSAARSAAAAARSAAAATYSAEPGRFADAAAAAVSSASFSAAAASFSAARSDAFSASEATFSAFDWDAEHLPDGTPPRDLFVTPLWPSGQRGNVPPGEPKGLAGGYAELIAFFDSAPRTWGFWKWWLEGMRTGQPMNWELQRKIALLGHDNDFEIWNEGPEAVARAISEIETAHIRQTKGLEPEQIHASSVSSLFDRAPIVQASLSSMSETITLRLDAFSLMARPNEKIAFVETLRSMPETAKRISDILEMGPGAADAESALTIEIGRLRAEVEQLRSDLENAHRELEHLRKKPWFRPSAVFVTGTMFSAIIAGLWALSGEDKTLETRWNKLASDFDFLGSQIWPEQEDRAIDTLKLELPKTTGL